MTTCHVPNRESALYIGSFAPMLLTEEQQPIKGLHFAISNEKDNFTETMTDNSK